MSNYEAAIPVYGFGAVPKHMDAKDVSHCFPLNGNKENPALNSLTEAMEAYRQNPPRFIFSGPTLIKPLLQQLYDQLTSKETQKVYRVLFLMVDGDIDDYEQSLSLLV